MQKRLAIAKSLGQKTREGDSTDLQASLWVNPRSLLEKIVTRSLEGGGGSIGPPSTFDTVHPIDLKFGTHNKLHLYFQLSETTWCLIGFHGNNS